MLDRKIFVRTSFEALHRYENAPDEVAYLRQPHRHIFHVEVQIQVFHDDRELEFIMVKHKLEHAITFIDTTNAGSCEQMAERLMKYLAANLNFELHQAACTQDKPSGSWHNDLGQYYRQIQVVVSEDNENGAIVQNY